MRDDRGQVADHVVEAELGGGDGGAHLGQLELVFDEAQLAEVARELGVARGVQLLCV